MKRKKGFQRALLIQNKGWREEGRQTIHEPIDSMWLKSSERE